MGQIYTIKKGQHYSNYLPKMCYGKTSLAVRFKFMDGCWFPLEVQDDYAINKLLGWSAGLHHRNSIRCGWTPNPTPGLIDLFFYLYINGTRKEQKFATVELGLEYDLRIDTRSDLVSFSLSLNGVHEAYDSVYYPAPKCRFGFWLWPYIGGMLPARLDTKIYLELEK